MARARLVGPTLLLVVALGACSDDESGGGGATTSSTTTSTTGTSYTTTTSGSTSNSTTTSSSSTTTSMELVVTERIELTTSLGAFVIGLYGEAAPVTVDNFLAYVDAGFFDGLVFHRVIPDFMIQGGGFDDAWSEPTTNDPIELEIVDGLSHQPGVIAMARTPQPNSATSQFFVNVSDNDFLDGDYAAFGMTESGYDVVEAISLVATETVTANIGGMDVDFEDVPVEPVVIESVVRLGR